MSDVRLVTVPGVAHAALGAWRVGTVACGAGIGRHPLPLIGFPQVTRSTLADVTCPMCRAWAGGIVHA